MHLSAPKSGLHTPDSSHFNEEDDIGLTLISELSTSLVPFEPELPREDRQKNITTPPLLSPSSPDLVFRVERNAPKLTRSKTLSSLPTLASNSKGDSNAFGQLYLEPDRVIKLRKWILALAIVDFDLDLGPVITTVYPSLSLSSSEEENIAFSSFPDSAQFDQGSQSHSFRIREVGHVPDDLVRYDGSRPFSDDGFIYGYSHFIQRKDPSSKRGYQQRSLVLLSKLPYPTLFSTITATLGPAFHTHGGPMLEAACHNIASWPDPVFGTTVELGFMGIVLQAELPVGLDEQQMPQTTFSPIVSADQQIHVFASMPPQILPPLSVFEASLSHLWSIWECLILCEPLLVFGSSPAMTSQAIWWLRDFLRPMPVAGDFRPYFTIHDKDHATLINSRAPQAGLLLGVTNPFYERTCKHWPHILSLGHASQRPSLGNSAPSVGPIAGWRTKTHKRYISKDHVLLKTLEQACQKDKQSQVEVSIALRRHFTSRTTEFLVPLNRYLNTLIPPPSQKQDGTQQKLKPFSESNFFASLKVHGSPLPFKSSSKQKEFYERWLRCPGFGLWLAKQEEIVEGVLNERVKN